MKQRGYLAIDIGGTKLAVGIVSITGEVLSSDKVATPQTNVWGTLRRLVESQRNATEVDLVGCGVGCGGPMTMHGELVSTLHISEWRDFPLRSSLENLLQMPIHIDNDAKALVLGEVWCGAVTSQTDVIGIVVSTGVGGGIISRGKIVDG